MKAVILAGGLGSRIGEETHLRPKPMITIGDQPILWHIMKMYSSFGVNEFIVCLGYKGYVIKEFFSNYFLHTSNVTFDMSNNSMEIHSNNAEPWRVTLVDTGPLTMTGGRVKRVSNFLEDEDFCLTYGDGVSDVNIGASIAFHRAHGRLATVTGVRPPGRFGALTLDGDAVDHFEEKPVGDGSWINGGFFVLSPKALDYIPDSDDSSIWEQGPMRALASDRQLNVFRHNGFWQCMDTVRDRAVLEDLWQSGAAPWKIW